MTRRKEQTPPVREGGTIREGDRVVVIDGEHAGRFGRVVLTHDSDHHRLVARMLALAPDQVRVVLDRTELGAWSGVIPLASLKSTRMETDAELHARVSEALKSGGEALDDCARHLGLERREVAFFGAGGGSQVFPK